ncbi:MAG: TonB-dependent receptor plug domain-containing protein [Lewinellaceae bacterium]|nr:TonB-dependent receptor plug domain-containing protein [Lewinellaceae bacterium]
MKRPYHPAILLLLLTFGSLSLQAQQDTLHPASASTSLFFPKFNQGNIQDPLQAVQGKMSGLSVARPGSAPNEAFVFRVRGLSSIHANTAPLVVIDGVTGASLSLLNPGDIASIQVLRDGASLARYGMRGAAGVVMVTTKKGAPERLSLNYEGQLAFDQASKRYTTFTQSEFLNAGGTDLSPQSSASTNWQDEILQTGVSHNHRLGLSTPLWQGALRASLHYRNMEGVLRESGNQQLGGQLQFSQSLLQDRLQIDARLWSTLRQADISFPEAFRYALTFNPTAAIKSSDPAYQPYGGYVTVPQFDVFNPVAMIAQNSNRSLSNVLLGSVRAEYRLMSPLSVSLQLARENTRFDHTEFYAPQSNYRQGTVAGEGSIRRLNQEQHLDFLDAAVHLKQNLGEKTCWTTDIGYSWQSIDKRANDTLANGTFGLDKSSAPTLFKGLVLQPGAYSSIYQRNENLLIAGYANTVLNFNQRYFFEAGIRREGSNWLGTQRRWGMFLILAAPSILVLYWAGKNSATPVAGQLGTEWHATHQ